MVHSILNRTVLAVHGSLYTTVLMVISILNRTVLAVHGSLYTTVLMVHSTLNMTVLAVHSTPTVHDGINGPQYQEQNSISGPVLSVAYITVLIVSSALNRTVLAVHVSLCITVLMVHNTLNNIGTILAVHNTLAVQDDICGPWHMALWTRRY